MADNTTLNSGTGGDVIRDKDRAGVKTPVVGLDINPAGAEVLGTGDATNGMDVDVTRVQGTVTTTSGGQGTDGSAVPAGTLQVGGTDGTNLQALATDTTGRLVPPPTSQAGATVKTSDYDAGAGTDTVAMQGIALPASGGAVQGGTGTNPVRTDPTGTTAQPVTDNGGSVTVDAPVGTPVFVRLSDGSSAIATLPVSLASLPALVAGSALVGRVQLDAATANGATPATYVSAASTNATNVKASAGQVYGVMLSNINAAARYLKIFNKASAPTVGTDTPVMNLVIPGNTAGAGSNVFMPVGAAFSTGIAFAITTGIALLDTGAVAANEITATFLYA